MTRIYAPCADEVYWYPGRCPAHDTRCIGCPSRPAPVPEVAAFMAARRETRGIRHGALGDSHVLRLVHWWAGCTSVGGAVGGHGEGAQEPEFILIRSQIGCTMAHVDDQIKIKVTGAKGKQTEVSLRCLPLPQSWRHLDKILVGYAWLPPVRWFLERSSSYVALSARPALVDALFDRFEERGMQPSASLRDAMIGAAEDIRALAVYAQAIDWLRYQLWDVVVQWPRLQTISGADLDKLRLRTQTCHVVG